MTVAELKGQEQSDKEREKWKIKDVIREMDEYVLYFEPSSRYRVLTPGYRDGHENNYLGPYYISSLKVLVI